MGSQQKVRFWLQLSAHNYSSADRWTGLVQRDIQVTDTGPRLQQLPYHTKTKYEANRPHSREFKDFKAEGPHLTAFQEENCRMSNARPRPGRLRLHLLLERMTDKPMDSHTDIRT